MCVIACLRLYSTVDYKQYSSLVIVYLHFFFKNVTCVAMEFPRCLFKQLPKQGKSEEKFFYPWI